MEERMRKNQGVRDVTGKGEAWELRGRRHK